MAAVELGCRLSHSDRGIQYCAPEFTNFTDKQQILLSNTQNSDPYENAIAERMNRTLKYEYGLKEVLPDLKTAEKNGTASRRNLQ